MADNSETVAATSSSLKGLRELVVKHQTALKYLFIGGMASAIDVILFMVMYNLFHTSEWMAHSISVPTSVLFSFIINARHNFKTNDHMWLRLASFSGVCLLGFIVGYGVIVAVEAMGLGANLGKIASLPVVFIIQFVLNSRITFRAAKT